VRKGDVKLTQPQESFIQANKDSFRSANAFPVKMLNTDSWFTPDGKVVPNHLQLNITNKCNLKCTFCSCADRDLSQWLTAGKILTELKKFKELGGKSVTIAGGGDPTVHPAFDEIIDEIDRLGIKIGLVTNGIRLDKFKNVAKLTWCRISLSYCNPIRDSWRKLIQDLPVDWAFSYVYTGDPEACQAAITDSENMNITHFRVVCDINRLDLLPLPKFENDSKVIYQPRETFVQGAKKCYIALMKPFLDVDGNYYPCCGVQYAREKQNEVRKIDTEMSMGSDFEAVSLAQVPFDGSLCTKCYYGDYNSLMDRILNADSPKAEYDKLSAENKRELIHLEFL